MANDATLARMVVQMAKKQARRGRPETPPMKKLSARRMIRLDPTLDSVVEVRRRQMEEESGEPVDWSRALRDILRAGAVVQKLLPQ